MKKMKNSKEHKNSPVIQITGLFCFMNLTISYLL